MNQERMAWLWLSNIPKVSVKQFWAILDYFGSAEAVRKATEQQIESLPKEITDLTKSKFKRALINGTYETTLESIEQGKYEHVLIPSDEAYPYKLERIYDPPKMLYYKGKPLNINDRVVGIVGSRHASYYGRKMAQDLAKGLAENGITVISGLAKGIDAFAHTGAIEGYGYTVGVLGCGIDVVYPPQSVKLYEQMEAKGTIISEYGHGVPPRPYNFPARNRIISAMSDCIVVVEAAKKSGAMITVDFANEHGKEVFAVPGNVTSKNSEGTNALLKEGVCIATCANDILENMGWEPKLNCNYYNEESGQLDFLETRVYNALKDGQYLPDEIARLTQMSIATVQASLVQLELKGYIQKQSGGMYGLLTINKK